MVGTTILDSTACIAIPIMANNFGSKGVMLCRFIQGLAQGFLLPSIHTLLGHWAPPSERSRIGTFAYAGKEYNIEEPSQCMHFLLFYAFSQALYSETS